MGEWSASHEIFGPRVVTDDRRGGLLRLVLPSGLLGDDDPETSSFEQLGNGRVVFEIGTCRIAPRIAATAVLLTE